MMKRKLREKIKELKEKKASKKVIIENLDNEIKIVGIELGRYKKFPTDAIF